MALAITICNNETKIFFSRQFIQMSKYELQNHISRFCRMLNEDNKNIVFIDDKYHYSFIPIENNNIYMVLTTYNNSNHFQNMKILNLSYKAIYAICKNEGLNEISIKNKSFDIILALDDIITQYGYLDEQNIDIVKQNLKMNSIDEKEFIKDKEAKDKEIKDNFERKMLEFEKQKKNLDYKIPNFVSSESLQIKREIEDENQNTRKLKGLQLKNARNQILTQYIMNDNHRIDALFLTCQTIINKMVEKDIARALIFDSDDEIPNTKIFLNPISTMAFLYDSDDEEEEENEL